MKLVLIVLALSPLLGTSAPDAFGVMQKVMAAAQQSLAVAEHRHGKVVKSVRKQAALFLQDKATAYGNSISSYSDELEQAVKEAQDAVSSAEAGLAKEKATEDSKKSNEWTPNDPAVELRAKLGSQVTSAQQAVKRAERQRTRLLREAAEHAEETLEDESEKLGRKVGDMTPLVDKAKKAIEAVVEKKTSVAAVAGKTTAQASEKVNLKVLEENLVKATAGTKARIASANKKVQDVLSKTDKDVALESAKLRKTLDDDEAAATVKKVVAKRVVKTAPAVKKVVATVVHDKAAPAKVKAAPATEKAAPAVKKVVKA